MTWRLAKSLTTLRNQVNEAYPNRSEASDGTIGDAAHAATASDHNPNSNGVVCALDLTHDPKNGFDAHALAEHLRNNRHPNLRYVISNARIAGSWTNWEWRPSVGHTQHIHVSVGNHGVGDGQTTSNYDSTQAWDINYKGGSMAENIGNAFAKVRPLGEGNIIFEFTKAGSQWKLESLATGKAVSSAKVKKGHRITCQAFADLIYKGKKQRYYIAEWDLKSGRLYGVNRADVKIIATYKH